MSERHNTSFYCILFYLVAISISFASIQADAQTCTVPPQLISTQGYSGTFTYTAVENATDPGGSSTNVTIRASGSMVFPFVSSDSGLGAVYKGSINETVSYSYNWQEFVNGFFQASGVATASGSGDGFGKNSFGQSVPTGGGLTLFGTPLTISSFCGYVLDINPEIAGTFTDTEGSNPPQVSPIVAEWFTGGAGPAPCFAFNFSCAAFPGQGAPIPVVQPYPTSGSTLTGSMTYQISGIGHNFFASNLIGPAQITLSWTLSPMTCGGDGSRDALIQQYRSFRGGKGVIDTSGNKFVPACTDITTGAGSAFYPFSNLNISNTTDSTVALLSESLLTGDGVAFFLGPPLFNGPGLDAWVKNYNSGNPLPTVTSGYRPPLDQQRVYTNLKKTPPPGSRHMFGDAVDLAANSSNWNALVNAAIDAGADFTESDPGSAGYPCGPIKKMCVHADWRSAVSPYAQ